MEKLQPILNKLKGVVDHLEKIILGVVLLAVSVTSVLKLLSAREELDAANKALLSLVMKMSEAQLRPLYSRLREWRGDLVKDEDDNESSIRRFSFWSMTAVLCKELRGIFLPCMSSVVGDIVQELVGQCSYFDFPDWILCFNFFSFDFLHRDISNNRNWLFPSSAPTLPGGRKVQVNADEFLKRNP